MKTFYVAVKSEENVVTITASRMGSDANAVTFFDDKGNIVAIFALENFLSAADKNVLVSKP